MRSRNSQRPVPHFKYVIVGEVHTGKLTCRDNTHYLIRYGKKDVEEVYPRYIPTSEFFISVEGCKNPHPNPQGPPIFVKGYHEVGLNEDYSFQFIVAAMQPVHESNIYLKKIIEAEDGSVGDVVDARFAVSTKRLT